MEKETSIPKIEKKYQELVKEAMEKEQRLEEQLWLDSNLNKLDDVLRLHYNKSIEDFAEVILEKMAELSQAFSGTFFYYNEKIELIEVKAGYACKIEALQKQSYQIGEGLIGQAVSSQKLIFFEDIPAEHIETSLSTVTLSVANVLIFPLVFNEVVYGVVELVYIQDLPQKYITLFRKFSRSIAVMLESISKNTENRRLLLDFQEQTEKLRTQEEELRQNIEELSSIQEVMERQKNTLEAKEKETQKLVAEMKANEEDMQRNEAVMRKAIKNLQSQKKEAREKDKLIKELQAELESLKVKE